MNAPNTLSKLDVYNCPLDGINLIEASAGTGKTWTICALYLRLLLEQQRTVDQILVVTFTNAAAAELRDRIRKRLVDMLAYLNWKGSKPVDAFFEQLDHALRSRASLTNEAMIRTLSLALNGFDEAAIYTIHGYCQRALADTPFSAGMPLSMELLEDDSEWLAEVVNDFWRRHVAGGEAAPELVKHLKKGKDTPELYAKVLRQHLQRPSAKVVWPKDIAETIEVDGGKLDLLLSGLAKTWSKHRDAIVELISTAGLSRIYYRDDYIKEAAKEWDLLLGCKSFQQCLLHPLLRAKLLAQSSIDDPKCRTRSVKVLPEHEFFVAAQQLLDFIDKQHRQLDLARLRLLRDLLAEGTEALARLKLERRVIAFNDMLSNLHERLQGPGGNQLAASLGQRYPVALVDEFQDTDPLQFAIFNSIYVVGQHPFFIVGDPKQAIYSFRNADLHTYLTARKSASNCYTIAENQRSSEALIDALNGLFGCNPRVFMLDGLIYPSAEVGANRPVELIDSSDSLPGALQVWELPDDPETGEPFANDKAQSASVRACTNEIARLLVASTQGFVRLGNEPLKAADLAVLVRTHAHGNKIRQALTRLGIGCVQRTQERVYGSTEAEELERVLLAILSPTQERLVRAALATEAIGMDAQALEALGSDGEGELQQVVQRFIEYRDTWQSRGIAVMLRRWFSQENITSRLLSHIDGERRLTNLLHLFELLHEAQHDHPSPEALMVWFQVRRQDPREDQTAQLRLESDENLVQIVTVHTAKGLEYPIVFCPMLWTQARSGDGGEVAAYYVDEQGSAVFDYNKVFGEDFKDIEKKIKILREQETAAESLRLIYVALTRAKQRCVIVAGSYFYNRSTKASAKGLLNWLVAGAEYTPQDWFKNELEPSDIRSAWQDFAKKYPTCVSLAPLPLEIDVQRSTWGDALELTLSGDKADLQALPATPPVPRGWRIGSYSALAHGARHERAAADHDLRAVSSASDQPSSQASQSADAFSSPVTLDKSFQSEPATTVVPIDATDILNFQRGAGAGDTLHGILESIDFTVPYQWPEVVDKRLRGLHGRRSIAHGLPSDPAAASSEQVADHQQLQSSQVLSMLGDVLNTPLPVGTKAPLVLSQLEPQKRLNELEFHIPVERLSAGDLNSVLEASGYNHIALSFTDLQGFFKGFIDLVLEHEGRYFVLDWKSNHLGESAKHYGQEPLMHAMHNNNYCLQSLVYSVALHRFLQQRLQNYDYKLHFGGAIYLFIRGVRPTWTDTHGKPAGFVFDRPSEQLLTMMDGLFALPHELLCA